MAETLSLNLPLNDEMGPLHLAGDDRQPTCGDQKEERVSAGELAQVVHHLRLGARGADVKEPSLLKVGRDSIAHLGMAN